jgi:hypothetical protein
MIEIIARFIEDLFVLLKQVFSSVDGILMIYEYWVHVKTICENAQDHESMIQGNDNGMVIRE